MDLTNNIPDNLYHYTSQEAFLGMITNKEIWMTSIHYLNDSTEFKYASEFVNETITEKQKDCPDDKMNKIYSSIKNELQLDNEDKEGIRPFIFSLSKEDDNLNQWRGYCQPAQGFCLAFKKNFFVEIKNKDNTFSFDECVYGKKSQTHKIEELCQEVIKSDAKTEEALTTLVRNKLWELIPLLKHEAFSAEKEWRLIYYPADLEGVKFRAGKSMLIPYFPLSIKCDDGTLPIGQILVGPTPNVTLSKISTEKVLEVEFKKPGVIKVQSSRVPFRTW